MIKISIAEDVHTKDEMVDLLIEIARQINTGFSSGYNPNWQLSGEEEFRDEDENG